MLASPIYRFALAQRPTCRRSDGHADAHAALRSAPRLTARLTARQHPTSLVATPLPDNSDDDWGVAAVGVPLRDIADQCTTDPTSTTRRFLSYLATAPAETKLLFCDGSDADVAICTSSKAWLKSCGYASEDVLKHSCRFLQGPRTAPATVQRIRRAVEAREVVFVNVINYKANGESFDNAFVLAPLLGPSGDALYFVSFHDPPQKVLRELFGNELGAKAAAEACDALDDNALRRAAARPPLAQANKRSAQGDACEREASRARR
ncbi:hypothetical protein M885DRAFT_593747 [Pelagophyceae sp. CCMP2097]|nr:hypothetical protein M885DRAFT_593747 [Pelagophyceae sp. CCMP2097]|mmetsp:Transcript_33811/g.118354  ORF Transcript_33811/g.118354 Transcript_33811/m.118354 type:complete len:264 (-) Transcript_33811:92-883(-)